MEAGCTDSVAVLHLLHAADLCRPSCDAVDIGLLERYQCPLPVMDKYGQLLAAADA